MMQPKLAKKLFHETLYVLFAGPACALVVTGVVLWVALVIETAYNGSFSPETTINLLGSAAAFVLSFGSILTVIAGTAVAALSEVLLWSVSIKKRLIWISVAGSLGGIAGAIVFRGGTVEALACCLLGVCIGMILACIQFIIGTSRQEL